MTRDEAYLLMTQMTQNPKLRNHALAVESIMRALAQKFGEAEEEYAVVGLLHDADYELVKKNPARHTLVTEEKLRPLGVSDRIINAIKAHHDGIKNSRENLLEKSIYAADELSGLIIAVALVNPEKKLSSVTNDSVLKKFSEKNFAAGANRQQILSCEKELGIPLADFINLSLLAMQSIANQLGL